MFFIYWTRLWEDFLYYTPRLGTSKSAKACLELICKGKWKFGWMKIFQSQPLNCMPTQSIMERKSLSSEFWLLLTLTRNNSQHWKVSTFITESFHLQTSRILCIDCTDTPKLIIWIFPFRWPAQMQLSTNISVEAIKVSGRKSIRALLQMEKTR